MLFRAGRSIKKKRKKGAFEQDLSTYNSSLQRLSANHFFGNSAENRQLELLGIIIDAQVSISKLDWKTIAKRLRFQIRAEFKPTVRNHWCLLNVKYKPIMTYDLESHSDVRTICLMLSKSLNSNSSHDTRVV